MQRFLNVLKACKYCFESLVLTNTVIYQIICSIWIIKKNLIITKIAMLLWVRISIFCVCTNRRSSGCTQLLFNVYGFPLQTRTSKFVFSSAENGFTRRRRQ